jgi:hypothetical protein
MTQGAKELVNGIESFFGHVAAIIVGLILAVVGLAMGVTIVMLPIGIPISLFGLGLMIWGLVGRSGQKQAAAKPSRQP